MIATRIVIKMPLPPRELSPNRRLRAPWYETHRHKVAAKEMAQACFYEACRVAGVDGPPSLLGWKSVIAHATYTVRSSRYVADADNARLWTKEIVDQMAQMLDIDDKHWHWRGDPEFVVGKPESLVLWIEEGTGD